jgi:LysR family transcriptional regulator, glycine cleavage system transcriptional activator
MKRTHLPLNALRVFEAAARHLSFTKAADELAVTPAAVGQQIRALEETLGVILFRRTARALMLTPEAERALPALRAGFEKMEEAVRAMQAGQTSKTLTISAPPSFAAKWLTARLDKYLATGAVSQVRLFAGAELVDFAQENVDLAIRYGPGGYTDLVVDKLMDEHVFPVASPAFLEARGGLSSPADLAESPLIHDDSSAEDDECPSWREWLAAAGVSHRDADAGLHFNQSALVLEAATAGRGVALAKRALAEADIVAGKLVRLFNESQRVTFSYYLVAPEPQWRQPKVQAFTAWLKLEARRVRV